MNLNGLNIICLETVLEYLEIVDLLNAADACTRLRHAARLVYERMHGETQLHIEQFDVDDEEQEDIQTEHTEHYILPYNRDLSVPCFIVKRPKLVFQLLRCFGHLIPSISFLFEEHSGRYQTEKECHFIDYINEFCSETLETLNIDCSNWDETLGRFNKPFTKVKRLGIANAAVESEAYGFTPSDFFMRLFPSMRSFEIVLFCDELVHDGRISQHIPNLENLSLFMYFPKGICNKCIEVYKNIICLNPQLKKLTFSNFNSIVVGEIVNFSEYFQNLERFEFKLRNFRSEETPHLNFDTLHLKRVKHLAAWSPLSTLAFTTNFMLFINKLSFDHLESFTLELATEPFAEQLLLEFCKKNQSIKKLKLIICPETVEPVLRINSRLVETLSLLEELEFTLHDFNIGEETTKLVHQTVTNILSTFEAIPTISINFTCPFGAFNERNPFACKIDKNFEKNFHDVWSTSWTDYKNKRMTFKRLPVPSKRKRLTNE